MNYLSVIDVGHGNCAFIASEGRNVVVDVASRAHLLRYLEANEISEIDLVVISHSDEDHIGGLINLLSSECVRVKQLVINSDSTKKTGLWEDVRALIDSRFYRGSLKVWLEVYAGGDNSSWANVTDRLTVEILSPSLSMKLGGPGIPLPGKKKAVTSNTASIVVRVNFDNKPVAVFAGDMDGLAVDEVIRLNIDMAAKYLVFPHHGGLPGGADPSQFAEKLLGLVKPDMVFFSNGRTKHGNPRKEIVDAVRQARPDAYIACTQVARHCCSTAISRRDYVPRHYSAGVDLDACCAGSVEIDLDTCLANPEQLGEHQRFVRGLPEAMCIKGAEIIAISRD